MADNWEDTTPDGISWRWKRNRKGEKVKGANGRYVKVYGWRTTVNGKEERVKPSEDLEHVRAERDRIRTSRREGTFVDRRKAKILFRDQAAKWLASKTDIDPDSSYRTYKSRLEKTINPLIGDTPMARLTPQALQDFVDALQSQGKHAATYFTLVCMVIRDAIAKDIIVRKDPKIGVIVPPKKERQPKSLSAQQFEAAEKAMAADDKLRTMFTVLAETGARVGEVLGLCEDQIDTESGEILLDRQMAKHHKTKEIYLKEPKSKAGSRRVLMSQTLALALKEWLKDNPPAAHVMRFRRRNGDEEMRAVRLLFIRYDGKPMLRDDLQPLWKKACDRAKVKITPHQLRHTMATFLIGDGVDVKTVQSVLGHSKSSITLDMYADPTDAGRQAARQSLNRRRIKAV
ncbi:tyrosine-type recombinase/integrase [Actinomadura fulvescens]|uniref:Tyrosine-type recombinase/integrase n=1 Tax=Actinomadura fulvescens TaxID=46160 RepID=A0ABN3QTT5_9ACTN